MKTFAIVLAAGASRRFGSAKVLAAYDGRPLISHVLDAVGSAGFIPLVVLGSRAEEIEAVLPRGVARIQNDRWAQGMGTSIAAGVRAARERGAEEVVVVAADTPKVGANDLLRLVDARRHASAAISAAEYDDVIGIPACFSQAVFSDLENLSEDSGARGLLRAEGADVVPVAMPSASADVDRVEDLEAL